MVEETVYDETIECHHSYSKRCHTTYITDYEPVQEEKCDENFVKSCYIEYKVVVFNESVDVCHTPMVKNCDKLGPIECSTEYETECSTVQNVHQVEEDVPDCRTENMEKCQDITRGYTTSRECETWPVVRCTLERRIVNKYSPETKCQKIPRELCGPASCSLEPGAEQCRKENKQIIQEVPEETCQLEPQRNCKYVTKLVPKLSPKQECLDVPKEVCNRVNGNPRKIRKPIVKKWCYVPSIESGLQK